eukprot:1138278-Pelagomonas_calceolata.AAC.4
MHTYAMHPCGPALLVIRSTSYQRDGIAAPFLLQISCPRRQVQLSNPFPFPTKIIRTTQYVRLCIPVDQLT